MLVFLTGVFVSERPHDPRLLLGPQQPHDPLRVLFADHQHGAQTAVKGAAHLLLRQAALPLQPREHGRDPPAGRVWNTPANIQILPEINDQTFQ